MSTRTSSSPSDPAGKNRPPNAAVNPELLNILRCPVALQQHPEQDDPGQLELVRETWLVCAQSGMKYPIRDGIPVMLVDEAKKWKDIAVDDLPIPPPLEEDGAAEK